MNFKDIPQFPQAHYEIVVSWRNIERHIADQDPKIILEPDYQRGHVWNDEQRTAFVEYGLMGGENSMSITTNCPGWMGDFRGPYELVDGLQRITAVRKFIDNEIKAFGLYFKEFEGKLQIGQPGFRWRVCSLPTRKEVLNFYLLLNTGGVVHSSEEIKRVRELLSIEK